MLRDTSLYERTIGEPDVELLKRRRYSKAERQTIVDEFMKRNGGVYDPHLFIQEAENPEHPAHDWFDWDDASAAYQWRLEQARAFTKGLTKVRFVHRHIDSKPVRIKVTVPSVVSPVENRRNGGGYVAFTEPEYIRQALRDAKGYLGRYRAALVVAGVEADMDAVIAGLEKAAT